MRNTGLLDEAIADILGQPRPVSESEPKVDEAAALAELPEEAQRAFADLNKAKEETTAYVPKHAEYDDPEIDWDKFYFGHELHFRGKPDAVIDRLRWYQGIVRRAHKITEGRPALDLKCGRGEWLLLMKKDEIPANGYDESSYNIETCRNALLDVTSGSWLKALRAQVDGKLGIVTAFRLVEYLTYSGHALLVTHALRVLAPGGVLVIETPNIEHPRTLQQWYTDPCRVQPAHPAYLIWLCKYFGFDKVEQHRINNGGEDFALIAHKA